MTSEDQQRRLKQLPAIDHILAMAATDPDAEAAPKSVLTRSARQVVQQLRNQILDATQTVTSEQLSDAAVMAAVKKRVASTLAPKLIPTINATGVVIHTNLGRSLLCGEALDNIRTIAGRYSNLEFDLTAGRRGSRYTAVEGILCEISGAEAAMVVNNNAAAVLICLETFARGRKVVVSRGELVEIGGSFRIPDVMVKSGAILTEVGTTNRTHLRDYEDAIDDQTALLLKVHKSNYSVVGFTAEVALDEMVDLGRRRGVPVLEDLGSGTFVDLSDYAMVKEPTVQDSVTAGVDVVTFSGDKLLGGPQAGIILGKKALIDQIKSNPLNRALRIDKMTLAALESTLRLYRHPQRAADVIPTLRMLTLALPLIQERADKLVGRLESLNDTRLEICQFARSSRVGGGALPLQELPSVCVGIRIQGITVNALQRRMRAHNPPIIARIEDDLFLMDVRTLQTEEIDLTVDAIRTLLEGESR